MSSQLRPGNAKEETEPLGHSGNCLMPAVCGTHERLHSRGYLLHCVILTGGHHRPPLAIVDHHILKSTIDLGLSRGFATPAKRERERESNDHADCCEC